MKISYKIYSPLFLMAACFIVLIALILFAYKNFTGTADQVEKSKSEVKALEKKLRILESNKILTQSQVTNYNQLLNQLIPGQEDFFSILYALERLSQKTNFIISNYAVGVSQQNPGRINVAVRGDGDAAAFLNFLENYKYVGGRLITNSSIGYKADNVGQIELNLSFYSKSVDAGSNEMAPLNPAQIALMREVQEKTTVVYKEETQVNTDYPTKSNPF